MELCKRMESLGLLILQNSPDFIFLQVMDEWNDHIFPYSLDLFFTQIHLNLSLFSFGYFSSIAGSYS